MISHPWGNYILLSPSKYSPAACYNLHFPVIPLLLLFKLLRSVLHFVTPFTAAYQASLTFTLSQSLLKLMSIESVMPPNHLILFHPLLLPLIFPSIRVFFQWVFSASGIGASASALPMNIQGWFPLGLTGWIFLQSKGLWRVFSSTTTQKHQITVDSDYSHKIERRLLLGRKARTNMDSVLKAEISLHQQRSL